MGQVINVRNDIALDTIITNVVMIDSVAGIIKCDIGIKARKFLKYKPVN
jgi:urease alpha subunit